MNKHTLSAAIFSYSVPQYQGAHRMEFTTKDG